MSHKLAVISGGGPVGAVTAIMLAQQGWKVQVFEQASLPTARPSQQDQRAYRLTLDSRAMRVLKLAHVNMQPIIASQGKLLEATIYKANGDKAVAQRIPVTDDAQSVRAYRDELALTVIKEAQRLFPHAIQFQFNAPIQKVDLHRRLVHHGPAADQVVTQVPYDLLVGADGAGSVVRAALQRVMPVGYMRRYTHKQVYSMGQVTPCSPEEIPPHSVIQAHAAKEGMVIWDAQGSDDCRVGLVLPQERAAALRKGNTEGVVKMLEVSAPALPHYARQAALELAQSNPHFYPMPSWTHLSQLHGPKTVLLGDAAHTMSPVLGQGLNAAMEDVAVFAQCLEQHQGNVDAALPAYNQARLPDVKAIMLVNEVVASSDAGLTVQNQDAAHKLWVTGHKFLFNLHMISHTVPNRYLPSMVSGPQLIKLVTGATPYRAFTSALYQDGIVLAGLVIAATASALYMV